MILVCVPAFALEPVSGSKLPAIRNTERFGSAAKI